MIVLFAADCIFLNAFRTVIFCWLVAVKYADLCIGQGVSLIFCKVTMGLVAGFDVGCDRLIVELLKAEHNTTLDRRHHLFTGFAIHV